MAARPWCTTGEIGIRPIFSAMMDDQRWTSQSCFYLNHEINTFLRPDFSHESYFCYLRKNFCTWLYAATVTHASRFGCCSCTALKALDTLKSQKPQLITRTSRSVLYHLSICLYKCIASGRLPGYMCVRPLVLHGQCLAEELRDRHRNRIWTESSFLLFFTLWTPDQFVTDGTTKWFLACTHTLALVFHLWKIMLLVIFEHSFFIAVERA